MSRAKRISSVINSTDDEIKNEITLLKADLLKELDGTEYNREITLKAIMPNIVIKPFPLEGKASNDDISYSTWLIGELKGKLQAQIIHREMQFITPQAAGYNYLLHASIVGALRVELDLLRKMLEVSPTRTSNNPIQLAKENSQEFRRTEEKSKSIIPSLDF